MATTGNPNYNLRAALVLGIIQVICAAANLIVEIPIFVEDLFYITEAGVGFWTAVFFLISGIVAIVSRKRSTNTMIIVVMLMNILAAVVAGVGFSLAVLFMIFSTLTGNTYYGDTAYTYKVAIGVTVAHCAFCVIAGVCAIVLSAICCQAVCCGANEQIQVIYLTTETQRPAEEGNSQNPAIYPNLGHEAEIKTSPH